MRTPTSAYWDLLKLYAEIKAVCDDVKGCFDYSPFEYLPGKIQGELRDIRKHLISFTVSVYQQRCTPNLKPGADFEEMITQVCGELDFSEEPIKAWFEGQTQDPQRLRLNCLQQIIDGVRHLVPYTSDGQEWGPLKDWRKLVSGKILLLHCYSWGSYNSISYNMNSRGEIDNLERLIDLVTVGRFDQSIDPATVKPRPWITEHINRTRQDPQQFYGKQAVRHPAVDAFQFFKNDKLKIWFKTDLQASDVASTITTGALIQEIPQTQLARA